MQAIARVNRVFRDKPGGLIVDYLGLADQLKQALATYTESGGKGSPSIDTAQVVAVLLEKYEVCCDLMHGFDWSKWMTGTPAERLGLLPAGQEHVLQQEDGKARFTKVVTDTRPPGSRHADGIGTSGSLMRGLDTMTTTPFDTISDSTRVIDTSFAFDFDSLLAELI